MGRPKQDGSHDLERAQTQIVFGRLRSENPGMTLVDLEHALEIGSKDGNTISRYLNGYRSKSLDELSGVIKKARKKKLLSARGVLGHNGDELLDPKNPGNLHNPKPSEVIATVNKKLHIYQKLIEKVEKSISELREHMHELEKEGVDFYAELDYPAGYPDDHKDTVPYNIESSLQVKFPALLVPPW
jgi:hypothetical protein